MKTPSRKESNDLSKNIIQCAYEVHNALGCGFLEKVYENALFMELTRNNIKVIQQDPIKVYYRNRIVGDYVADLMIDDNVIVELKASKAIDEIHKAQLLNYLRAANLKLGLILNFGKPKLEIKRLVNNF